MVTKWVVAVCGRGFEFAGLKRDAGGGDLGEHPLDFELTSESFIREARGPGPGSPNWRIMSSQLWLCWRMSLDSAQ